MDPLTLFINSSENIEEFEAEFDGIPAQEHSEFTLATHLEELKAVWTDVKRTHAACLQKLTLTPTDPDKSSEADIIVIKSRYKRCYAVYVRLAAKIASKQHLLAAPALRGLPSTAANATTEASARSTSDETLLGHHFNLPPCDTDIFKGDYKSWPTFRDMFSALYIRNSRLSPVEKLFHLNLKTQGEAREIVQQSTLTDDGFQEAWTNLTDRYENKRILINIQIRALLNLNPINKETGIEIKRLQRDINNCLSVLNSLDIDVDSWDPIIVHLCSSCLPEATLSRWEHSLTDNRETPKWKDMDKFLTSQFQALESVQDMKKPISPIKKTLRQTVRTSTLPKAVHTFQANTLLSTCKLCNGQPHSLRQCSRFLELSLDARWATVQKLKFCINCLAHSHQLRECKSTFSCMSCKQRHHSLLHRDVASSHHSKFLSNSSTPSRTETHSKPASTTHQHHVTPNSSTQSRANTSTPTKTHIQSTDIQPNPKVMTCLTSTTKQVLLATAMVSICYQNESYLARALIDPGSEVTFVTERIQKRLRLPLKTIQAQVSSVNQTVTADINKLCLFYLSSPKNSEISIEVKALVLQKLTNQLPVHSLDRNLFDSLPNIPLADEHFFQSDQIDILIGADLYPLILLDGIKRNVLGSLIAQETIFGWILTGPFFQQPSTHSPTTRVSFFNEVSLDRQISQFWELEEIPKTRLLSPADKYCEELYANTTHRRTDGRYIVSLPFKEEFSSQLQLGKSREIALQQFLRNEKRLSKTPSFKETYDSVIREYSNLNHMTRVNPTDISAESDSYYLPHHAVFKPESSSTKVRVVFNASNSTSNGLSLNDVLYPGPALQTDLTFLLLKWRLFKYVLNGDIEKMYRQIMVKDDHARYQRILFRESPSDEIQDFELRTVTFGVNCAPFLAIRTLHQLARDVEIQFPLASSVLKTFMYVDDALFGAHDIATAIRTRDELTNALLSAGFVLRKWTANHPKLLDGIPSQDLLHQDFLKLDDASSARTLGLHWTVKTDEFSIEIKPFSIPSSYTKREMLSLIARLFDPAGWLAPVTIIAKSLMQHVWLEGTGWDEPLSSQTLPLWLKFVQCYSQINSLKIPRWIHFTPSSKVEIHAFCDASERAYASVVYVRIINPHQIYTSLLYAKTRVAPIKTLSIPRLELCGATLLADMLTAVIPHLNFPQYEIYCWTDSTIVLAWLRRPPCTWTTFVANRVSKIADVVDKTHWFHVESQHNPADLASRGLYPLQLINTPLWWHGPEWLSKEKEYWPLSQTPNAFETQLEARPINSHFVYFSDYEDILLRFSSLSRALRVLAYVHRFFERTHPRSRNSFHRLNLDIDTSEIQHVQTQLYKLAQKAYFAQEYHNLASNKILNSRSSILSLNPFLSSEGILRVGGRLTLCPSLSYDERHPILLPYECALSRLLVDFIHRISLHGGNQLMLRLLRTQYWIPKAKNLIKTVIHNCKVCVLQKKQTQNQIMAALPRERLNLSRPFAATGLDFAGPFEIKNYTGRACLITKGYVCIFVCFATKAIHLEATSDLSTSTFLAAFSRFVSRRGCPRDLYSDNGKNFVGASKTLRTDWKEFLQQSRLAATDQYTFQQLHWHFIPAAAPHMGGLWEAGVKSFKLHFRKFIGEMRLTFEEFSTILSKIEACLNSRPLSCSSESPFDLEPLTPGHFLIGAPLLAPAEPEILQSPLKIVNRWQKVKAIYQKFCSRWKNEYLLELQKRHKWKFPHKNLEVGDLVVIREENLSPTHWRLGRVIRTFPGHDDKIRVVEVRTDKGVITRAINKLVLLPL